MLYRQSRWKRFDRTNFVVILYVQHVHYDITIDRADVLVARIIRQYGSSSSTTGTRHQ